jgi:hypothetical protein
VPTKNLIARVPSDLREKAQARADQEGRYLTGVVISALRAYLTGDDGGEARHHTARKLAGLEAENAGLRAELEHAKQGVIKNRATELEKRARAELTEGKEARFTAAFQAATKEDPATAPRLAAMSGFSRYWCRDLGRALTAAGYAEAAGPGQWVPLPGKDIREGLPEAKALAQHGAARIAPGKREAPAVTSPEPVPAVPAAEATQAADGNAAAKGNGRIAGAVFKAGPDVDCLHDSLRGVKGVCPDCKQWVTK